MEINYTAWNGEKRSWNPELNGHFFVIVNAMPTKAPNVSLQLEHGVVGKHLGSADEAREYYTATRQRFPGFDWSASQPRIVKAPCAFDAHKNGVLVEALPA